VRLKLKNREDKSLVFDLLRGAFSNLIERVKYRTLSERELRAVIDNIVLDMVSADVALDVAEDIASSVIKELSNIKIERGTGIEKVIVNALKYKILQLFEKPPDILSSIRSKCSRREPYVIVFFGINGVGKTTTIAKIAYMLKNNGITPILAAADTFRAGAQEQLEVHAHRINIPVIKGKYGSDPASVAHDAIEYARARNICAVLIDTAGRMHVDYDLMGEMRKIVKVSKPDLKILVVDALTGNDAVEQARKFNEEVGVDAVIVAKVDADVKGGTILSVAAVTGKPILYIGLGQKYEDLEPFNIEKYVDTILGLRS